MKAKVFFSILVAALLSLQVVSATDKNDVSGKSESLNDVRAKLVNALNNVTFSDGGSVKILIHFDESGKVGSFRVDGSDNELISEVKSKIKNLKLEVPENYVGNYELKVNFVDAFSHSAALVAVK